MADSSLTPPILDPSQYPAYLDAQHKQQLAQMLMGAFQQSNQTPPEWNSMRVVPKRGALGTVATLATALMAGKAQKDSLQAQQQYFQGLYDGGPASGPADASPPGLGSSALFPGAAAPDATSQAGPRAGNVAPTTPAVTPAPSTRNRMIPAGMSPGQAQAMYNAMGPDAYFKMVQGPEAVQLARFAGVDPSAAARGALAKSTAIELRPGGTVIDPMSGRTMVGADPGKGEYYGVGPDGTVRAFPIENDATIQAWRAGLQTAAQQANTPRDIPMGGGATRLGYPDTPPALRGNVPAAPAAGGGTPTGAPRATPAPALAPAQGAGRPSAGPPGASAVPAPSDVAAVPKFDSAWTSIPHLAIPYSPGMSSDARTMGRIQNANAKDRELSDQYGAEAKLADQALQYNAWARGALPSAEVGPLSEWLTTNRAKLLELGVPASLVPSSGTIAPTLELNKALTNAALQGAKSIYGPRMTQNEVNLQKEEASPSAVMTRDAIASLIGQQDALAGYQKQRASDFARYTGQGGDPIQFEQWYAKNRPLSRFVAQQSTPTKPGKDGLTPLQRLQARPETLAAFKSTFGWDPTQ